MRSVRQGGVFLGSRAVNGALAVLQILLVTRAVGPSQAGRFFLLWTAAWLLSVVVKFGADGILPRAVAEARVADEPHVSVRRATLAGLACGAALMPLAMALLGVALAPLEFGLVVGLSLAWAANGILAALLKAHGRADLSGIVSSVIWPLGPSLAPLVVLVAGGDWETIAELTLLASVLSLGAAAAVTVRGVGAAPVRDLVGGRGPVPLHQDEVGAALLTTLYEIVIWLPVLLGGLLDLSDAQVAGLFSATRLAGLFSWGYQAVLTVLVAPLAAALANRDAAAAARALRRGSLAGIAVTWPPCLIGALLAGPMLGVFDSSYESWATVLALLIAARAVDAATGPLGEALLVGRRTWVDVGFVLGGVALAVIATVALKGSADEDAIGIGAAAGFIATNLARFAYVRWMLADLDRSRPVRSVPLGPAAGATLAVAVAVEVVCLAWPPGQGGGVVLAVVAALFAALSIVALGVARRGWRVALTSPLLIVALVLIGVFVMRPGSLLADPRTAGRGLIGLGWDWSDVTSTVALATLCFTAFSLAFILAWRGPAPPADAAEPLPTEGTFVRGALVALGLGVLLWGALFLKNGGFNALFNDPAQLHLEQFSGGYGVIGYMLCLGTTLLTLWAWLRRPSRRLLVVLVGATVISVLAAFALQTRGPLVASIVGAIVIAVHERHVSGRRLTALSLVAVLLVFAFGYMRIVREYAQSLSVGEAISAGVKTDPLTVVGGDFSEVENFVALRELVPDPLSPLDGRSIAEVPGAFLPRAIWSEKPKPVDFALSEQVYGAGTKAGTPFTIAGELFWNYGELGAIIGMFVFGVIAGLAWTLIRRRASGAWMVACATLVGYSYLVLTRPLGPMLLTLAEALLALGAVACLAGLVSVPAPFRQRLRLGAR
jgi:oligosaccharide repeat unit polymerase